MPGKDDGGSDKEKNLELFLKVGLDERTAKNTIANNKVTANLTAVIHEVLDRWFFFFFFHTEISFFLFINPWVYLFILLICS